MNLGIRKSSNIHNSAIFRRRVTSIIPACLVGKGACYGAIVVCVCVRHNFIIALSKAGVDDVNFIIA